LVVDTKSAPKLEGKRNRRRRSRQIAILVTWAVKITTRCYFKDREPVWLFVFLGQT
jgi:hypothetical protein